jgi:hypothetical protein
MLSVLHVGFHKNVTDRLILGARAKIYMSSFNATSNKNSGYIYTVPAENTIYEQVISSDMQLNTSISEYISEGYNGDAAGDIRKKALFGKDLGLGFDLGLTSLKRIFSLQPVFLMSVLLNTVKMLKPLL